MATNKKKHNHKSKTHIKQSPPLSKLDKFIYNITAIGTVFVYFLLPLFIILFPSISIRDENIYAVEYNNTLWLIVPIILYSLYLIAVSLMKTTPIFGNPKVNYFDTLRYSPHIYPIFDKRYTDKTRIKKFFIKTIITFIIIPIILSFLGMLGLRGRTEIGINGITKYNIKNEIVEHYIPEKIEKYTVSASSHYYRSGTSYTIDFKLSTSDGKEFYFDSDGFKDINSMKKLENSLLSNKPKTVEDSYDVDRFIYEHCNKEEAEIVRNIFNRTE